MLGAVLLIAIFLAIVGFACWVIKDDKHGGTGGGWDNWGAGGF